MPHIPVGIHKRLNHDKSYTLSLRYTDEFGKDIRQRFCKTEPKCTLRRLKGWMQKAADGAAELERSLQGAVLDRKQVTWRTFDDAYIEYLAWAQSVGVSGEPNCATGTVTNQSRHIGQLIKFVRAQLASENRRRPHLWIHNVWRYRIAAWRDTLIAKGLAAGTVNSMLASIAAWFRWAVDHGYAWNNPVAGVLRVKEKRGHRANLPIRAPEDLANLVGSFEQLDRKVSVILLAHTGLRKGEAEMLRWEHVENGVLHVQPTETETTKLHKRAVPMTEALIEALAMLKTADSSSPYVLSNQQGGPLNSQIGKWLNLPDVAPADVTPQDLRMFFITAMETIGAPDRVIDDLVGHSPGKVRAAYTPADNLEASRPWIREFEKWLDT